MIRRKDFLTINYWKSNYKVKSEYNMKKLIEFYKSILSQGHRDLKYIEHHHMVPKCMNYDEIIDSENIIELTPKEHFIAHLILSKCFEGDEASKMMYAIHKMCHCKNTPRYEISAKEYENSRKFRSEQIRKYNLERIWINNGICNKFVTENEFSSLFKDKGFVKGRIVSNSSKKGLIFVNNGEDNKQIKSSELEYYKSIGYSKGMIYKRKFKKIWVNDGSESMVINENELDLYLFKGYIRGRASRKKVMPS